MMEKRKGRGDYVNSPMILPALFCQIRLRKRRPAEKLPRGYEKKFSPNRFTSGPLSTSMSPWTVVQQARRIVSSWPT